MKFVNKPDAIKFIKQIKTEGITLRRRFILYIISAIALVLSLIALLLNTFGILNHANIQMMNAMDTQLTSHANSLVHNYDKIAAYAISFSEQLEAGIQNHLTNNNLSFDELENNSKELINLQSSLYDTVYLNMQLAPSSGAFYILNTTVNSNSDTPMYNGIYLKYINLYSESTVNNDFSLYRGSYNTSKENDITFHSGWQNEMKTDFFSNYESIFTNGVHYVLSPVTTIPDTWERARYIYVPIHNINEDIIGVCGFEINDLYYQLVNSSYNTDNSSYIFGLLDEHNGTYSGQFTSSRYNTVKNNTIKTTHNKNSVIFDFTNETCVGKTENVQLGSSTFTIAIMLTEAEYDKHIFDGQVKITIVFLIVALIAFIYCFIISKKYIAPILKKLEQIKTKEKTDDNLKIHEIDDLFAYLEERDNAYEEQLNLLKEARQSAEEEAEKSRLAYEKALKEYEAAQNEIQLLSKEHEKTIVSENYEYFICNLATLTPTESKVYELYLEGKSTKEIIAILNITENTLKYHNKNIYSKLGISSRKQLLKYAALKQQQDKKV
ncbi:MAG: hypothetical protein E7265_09965 [Lachnospiraceae bacterium]|nr:hypothetical protein [Lachnospiraceae bacterium]